MNKQIEAQIYYLALSEGGRRSSISDGYRGQFYYDGLDWDATQYFPKHTIVDMGQQVPVILEFTQKKWEEVHSKKIFVGMLFLIREGARIVGHGVVTQL